MHRAMRKLFVGIIKESPDLALYARRKPTQLASAILNSSSDKPRNLFFLRSIPNGRTWAEKQHLDELLTACCRYSLTILLVFVLGAINARSTMADGNDELQKLFHDYHEQYVLMFPIEATGFGDNRFNDHLPLDISPEFALKEKQFYEKTLQRLTAIDASDATPVNHLMKRILEYELQMRLKGLEFNADRIPFTQFDGLQLTFAQFGSGTSSQPFKSVADYDNWLKRVDQFVVWMRVAQERFREGIADGFTLPAILVERIIDQIKDPTILSNDPTQSIYYGPITNLPAKFSEQEKTRLTQQYSHAITEKLVPAYRELLAFLENEYLVGARTSSGVGELPNGKEYYKYCVRKWTTSDITPDEVYATGEREVARIREEMEKVKARMHFSGTLDEFFQHLREDPKYKPFNNPEEVLEFFVNIKRTVEPALDKAFLQKPKTPFEIRRTESFRELTASAEYMPGSKDGTRPGIFYCPIPDAKKFNITSGMESLFLHEALPGHHYQVSLQQENELLPEFAKFLWYGAYGEGWALYCESMGEELGLYKAPEQKMGALGDEMHRAIRLVVDVGLHWKGWTREQAIEYMMANEPISEQSAVAEVERYMAYPGQALSYKIGQLKILELRKRCELADGEQFKLAKFHDVVLRNGSMPLKVLEEEVVKAFKLR